MKKYIIFGLTIITVIIASVLFYRNTKDTPVNTIRDIQKNLQSYEIEGKLEFVDEESLRNISIRSLYKKVDDLEYFYVRLEDSSTGQVQTIVRNKNGVFVISQGFNRAFQFKTDWPYNGFKPYILQNVFEAINSNASEEKIRDGFIVNAQIEDAIQKDIVNTQILFDQNMAIKQINLLDIDGNEKMTFELSSYMLNPEIDMSLFDIAVEESSEVNVIEDLPMYPLESYEAELIDHLQTSEGHVLRYKGDKYFTLIQSSLSINDELSIENFNGDFYLGKEGLLIFSDDEVSLIKNGIKTSIYSNDLTTEEMQNVLLSMQNYVVIPE